MKVLLQLDNRSKTIDPKNGVFFIVENGRNGRFGYIFDLGENRIGMYLPTMTVAVRGQWYNFLGAEKEEKRILEKFLLLKEKGFKNA